MQAHIQQINSHYESVCVDKYVVMPNHVHMILVLSECGKNNLAQIVGQFKSGVTRDIRKTHGDIRLWQRSFHDHVIRNQGEYEKIWTYIENNPQKWEEDCFYSGTEQEL